MQAENAWSTGCDWSLPYFLQIVLFTPVCEFVNTCISENQPISKSKGPVHCELQFPIPVFKSVKQVNTIILVYIPPTCSNHIGYAPVIQQFFLSSIYSNSPASSSLSRRKVFLLFCALVSGLTPQASGAFFVKSDRSQWRNTERKTRKEEADGKGKFSQ